MDQIWVVSEKTRQWGPSVSFTLNLEVTPHSLQLLRYSQKSSGTHSDYSHFPLCTTCAGWEMKNQVLDTKGVSVVKGRGVGVEHRPYLCHLPDITLWHAHQGSLHCGIEKWQYFFVFFFATQHSIWDLSSLTRNQTHLPCIGIMESCTESPGKSQKGHIWNYSVKG